MFYVEDLEDEIKKQFIENSIGALDKPVDIFELKNLEDLDPQTLEKIRLIFNFNTSNKSIDISEYAFAWLLNAKHVGREGKRYDLIDENGKTYSIKHSIRKKSDLKLGRVVSSKSFKDLNAIWGMLNFFYNSQDSYLNTIHKASIEAMSDKVSSDTQFTDFLKSLNDIRLHRLSEVLSNPIEEIKGLINEIAKESMHDVNHIILLKKDTKCIFCIKDLDEDIRNNKFYENHFKKLDNSELSVSMRET